MGMLSGTISRCNGSTTAKVYVDGVDRGTFTKPASATEWVYWVLSVNDGNRAVK